MPRKSKSDADATPFIDIDTETGELIDADESAHEILALVRQARFNPEKLIGEVGDFLLSDLRASRELKPWAQLSEQDQRALIERSRAQAREIVAAVVQAIAAKGFTKIDAMLEGGSWKEGEITAKIKARLTPENLDALASGASFVQVVFATAEAFEAPMTARPEPDQRALDLAAAQEHAADEDAEGDLDEEPVFDATDAGRAL